MCSLAVQESTKFTWWLQFAFDTWVVIFIDSYLGSARLYVHDIFVACGSYEFDFVFHYILLNMLK
jgi:hypothetical protein